MRVFWQICVISALVIFSVSAIINNYASSPGTSIYGLGHKGMEHRVVVKGGKQNRRLNIEPVGNRGGKQDMAQTTQEVISTSAQIRQFRRMHEKSIGAQSNSLDPRRLFVLTVGEHANQFPGINHLKIEREPSTGAPELSKNPPPQYINIRPSFVSHTNASADKGIPENHPNSHLSPNLRRLLPIQSSPSTLSPPTLFRPQEESLDHPNYSICDMAGKLGIHDRHPPPNPYLQIALSQYGVHWPLVYGHPFGGIYGYSAANDIHNNQPFGGYKVTEEYD